MLELKPISCKNCGQLFQCQAQSGDCWCFRLEHLIPLSEEAQGPEDCFCPDCLEKKIEARKKEKEADEGTF